MSGRRVALMVDESVFPLSVVTRAAYSLTGRAYVFIHHVEGELAVVLRPKNASDPLDDLVGELSNAMVDHRLRHELANEFAAIHTAIVQEAFSPLASKGR